MTLTRTTRKINVNKLNLFLDLALAIVFAIEMEERTTGTRNHELLGLAFALMFLIHILLHWKWIVSIVRHFFKRLFHESRLNFVLNAGLLVAMGTATVTGIIISKTLGLNLGISGQTTQSMHMLHTMSSQFSLIIVGLHVAMHWKWIVDHSLKYLFAFPVRLVRSATTPVIALISPAHRSSAS